MLLNKKDIKPATNVKGGEMYPWAKKFLGGTKRFFTAAGNSLAGTVIPKYYQYNPFYRATAAIRLKIAKPALKAVALTASDAYKLIPKSRDDFKHIATGLDQLNTLRHNRKGDLLAAKRHGGKYTAFERSDRLKRHKFFVDSARKHISELQRIPKKTEKDLAALKREMLILAFWLKQLLAHKQYGEFKQAVNSYNKIADKNILNANLNFALLTLTGKEDAAAKQARIENALAIERYRNKVADIYGDQGKLFANFNDGLTHLGAESFVSAILTFLLGGAGKVYQRIGSAAKTGRDTRRYIERLKKALQLYAQKAQDAYQFGYTDLLPWYSDTLKKVQTIRKAVLASAKGNKAVNVAVRTADTIDNVYNKAVSKLPGKWLKNTFNINGGIFNKFFNPNGNFITNNILYDYTTGAKNNTFWSKAGQASKLLAKEYTARTALATIGNTLGTSIEASVMHHVKDLPADQRLAWMKWARSLSLGARLLPFGSIKAFRGSPQRYKYGNWGQFPVTTAGSRILLNDKGFYTPPEVTKVKNAEDAGRIINPSMLSAVGIIGDSVNKYFSIPNILRYGLLETSFGLPIAINTMFNPNPNNPINITDNTVDRTNALTYAQGVQNEIAFILSNKGKTFTHPINLGNGKILKPGLPLPEMNKLQAIEMLEANPAILKAIADETGFDAKKAMTGESQVQNPPSNGIVETIFDKVKNLAVSKLGPASAQNAIQTYLKNIDSIMKIEDPEKRKKAIEDLKIRMANLKNGFGVPEFLEQYSNDPLLQAKVHKAFSASIADYLKDNIKVSKDALKFAKGFKLLKPLFEGQANNPMFKNLRNIIGRYSVSHLRDISQTEILNGGSPHKIARTLWQLKSITKLDANSEQAKELKKYIGLQMFLLLKTKPWMVNLTLGIYFRSLGWDKMAEFALNPALFYSVALGIPTLALLFGGLASNKKQQVPVQQMSPYLQQLMRAMQYSK